MKHVEHTHSPWSVSVFMHDVAVGTCRYMCVRMRVCNQSRFGTLQEVINSHDYCADTIISKVLHNSLCGKGWLNQSTWKGRETSGLQHPVAAHLPLSLLLPSVSFVKRKGFEHQSTAMLPWRQKQLVRDLVKGGIEENPFPWYSKDISGK